MNLVKIGLSTLALSISFQFSNVLANGCNIVPNGLVACYPFDGDAKDYSGNANDGIPNGGIVSTADRFGNLNSAYRFDGTNDFVLIPVNINPNVMPTITMSAWVLSDNYARADARAPIRQIISHDDGGFDRSIGIDNREVSSTGWTAFAGSAGIIGGYPIDQTKWTFIAVSYDQVSAKAKLYVNGALFSEVSNATLGTGWSNTRIGSSPSFGEYFYGKIDGVRIYNRALSEDEIKQLYNAPNNTKTGECANPASYDAETGLVTLRAIDIPLLSPISGAPTGEIAVFSGKIKQVRGIEDFEIVADSWTFINMISQYDETHARYEYNDGIFANGGKLKACVSVPSIAIIPPNTRVITGSKDYKVSLRHLAVSPSILHLESAELAN